MPTGYFHRLHAHTQSRMWVNNPTAVEAAAAIAQGAIAATTNPTYGANMIQRDAVLAQHVIGEAAARFASDDAAADWAQQQFVAAILPVFRPLFERSGGRAGWVAIQGDPHRDSDAAHIVDEARRYAALGPNVIAKIPVTAAGLQAIETVLAEGMPVIATEVFGPAQAIPVGAAYLRATVNTGRRPACFLTHITGIFDDHIAAVVKARGIVIAPEVLAHAGAALAREQYRVVTAGKYPVTMLGGGARAARHFTGMVGGTMHVTINPPMISEIERADLPIADALTAATPPAVLDELLAKLPDFRLAWDPQGLAISDFDHFGPVRFFRSLFITGWDTLVAAIAARRPAGATTLR